MSRHDNLDKDLEWWAKMMQILTNALNHAGYLAEDAVKSNMICRIHNLIDRCEDEIQLCNKLKQDCAKNVT